MDDDYDAGDYADNYDAGDYDVTGYLGIGDDIQTSITDYTAEGMQKPSRPSNVTEVMSEKRPTTILLSHDLGTEVPISVDVPRQKSEYAHDVMAAKVCVSMYKSRQWISGYDYTLIAFPKKMNTKYIASDDPATVYEGMRLYKPNNKFYLLGCNEWKNKRRQEGNIYTAYSSAKKSVKFIVVHVLKDGQFVVQNENVFAAENEWFRRRRMGQDAIITEMLSVPLRTDIDLDRRLRQVVVQTLVSELGDEYRTYAAHIEDGLYEGIPDGLTAHDYLQMAANILVYIIKFPVGDYARVFNTRIRERVLVPTEVWRLSETDKLPEVFLNINMSARSMDGIQQIIESTVSDIVSYLSSTVFLKAYPMARKEYRYILKPYSISVPDYKSRKCDAGTDLDEWETIRYTGDDQKEYCFSISELVTQFDDGVFTNKHTGKEFDIEFVKEVLETFQESPIMVPVSTPVEDLEKADAFQDVIDVLYADIHRLEKDLVKLPVRDRPAVCRHCDMFIRKGGVASVGADSDIVKFCDLNCMTKSSDVI